MDVLSYALSKKYTNEQINEQKLKVAKLEQELNNYKAVMSQVNVNQEATQKVSGYSVLSLPRNAANGQVSDVVLKGQTRVNLLGDDGDFEEFIAEVPKGWIPTNVIIEQIDSFDGGKALKVRGAWSGSTLSKVLNVQSGKKYIILGMFKRIDDAEGNPTLTIYDGVDSSSAVLLTKSFLKPDYTSWTVYANTFTPTSNVCSIYIRMSGGEGTRELHVDKLCVIEIELGDYNSPVNDLLQKYTYINGTKSTISAFRIRSVSEDETQESSAYVIATDADTGEILELRSLPNGTKDEVRLSEGKLIKRIGEKTNVASGAVINYADMAEGGTYYAWNEDGETETGIKGDTLGIDATTLIYQLAEPVEIPVQVSGTLLSYPSGTVYVEPFVADAGLYNNGIIVLHQDLPIKSIEKISKIDYKTGLETILDASKAVIASDKLSFTHPDLSEGDIVFFEYEYDVESTEGETEVEFYDSRYVVKDTETGKFYKWNIVVANGQPSIELVEV